MTSKNSKPKNSLIRWVDWVVCKKMRPREGAVFFNLQYAYTSDNPVDQPACGARDAAATVLAGSADYCSRYGRPVRLAPCADLQKAGIGELSFTLAFSFNFVVVFLVYARRSGIRATSRICADSAGSRAWFGKAAYYASDGKHGLCNVMDNFNS